MKHVYMLFAAIALEVTGTTFMKFSVMHEWLIGYPVMLLLMGFSYFCLSKAVKKIPISVAYAVWEGKGSKKNTHQRCLRSLGRHWPYGHRLYCLDYF